MTANDMVLHCAKCNMEWRPAMPKLPMTLRRAAKVLVGIAETGCPLCGAFGRDVLCGYAPVKNGDPAVLPFVEEKTYK